MPEVGDGVWIEFEGGDLGRPIWSGCWWADDQRPEPSSNLARLLATSPGHQILLDEEGDEIKIVHPGGAEIVIASDEIRISIGQSTLKLTSSEINLNDGMAKITTAGASLVNDAFKWGADAMTLPILTTASTVLLYPRRHRQSLDSNSS